MSAPRILVALPAGPVAAWRARAVAALREAGARVRLCRTPHPAGDGGRHGALARLIFALEARWSSGAPTGLECVATPDDDPFAEAPDIRLSLAGDGVFTGHPPHGGDWCVGFPDTRDPVDSARKAVLAARRVSAVRLRIRYPDGSRARREAFAGVRPHSATDTLRTTLALAAALPARELKHRARPDAPDDAHPGERHDAGHTRSAARHLIRLLRDAGRDALTRKQWYLRLGARTRELAPEPRALTAVFPPPDRIWADPFVHEDESGTRVFFEEMRFGDRRGRIAVGRWDGQRLTDIRPALETEHHLSYPQIFRHAGRLWLTAESAQSGVLRAYACERMPDRWSPGPVIFAGPLLDPSLFEHEGRWWLFGNPPPGPGAKADGELHLYFSDDPLSGRWTPHPLNPVVSDARCGRGAGRPFLHDGRRYRPAQDCAGGYGLGVTIFAITTLTPTAYAEQAVGEIGHALLPGAVALHTLQVGETAVAMDAARRIWRGVRARNLP